MAEIGNVTVRVDAVITDEQYREAMSAVRAANERMDLLEAENAKLREQLEYDRQTSRSRLERIDQLKAENAKLRELVRDMVDYGEGAGSGMAEWFADRMRELGVEVG